MSTLANPMPDHIKAKLRDMKGKPYLEVPYRVVWFREDHPDWGIQTGIRWMNDAGDDVVFGATITNETGRVIAEGTCRCTLKEFPLGHWEKAETQAIGRALGFAGYGTQFDDTMYDVVPETKLADAPPQAKRNPGSAPPPAQEPTKEYTPAEARKKLYIAASSQNIGYEGKHITKWDSAVRQGWVAQLGEHFGMPFETAAQIDAIAAKFRQSINDIVTLRALPGYGQGGLNSEE